MEVCNAMSTDAAILERPPIESEPQLLLDVDGERSDVIPAITLWQPWATLWAAGLKKIETRSWSTPVRGRVLIHAAAKWDALTREACANEFISPALAQLGYLQPVRREERRADDFMADGGILRRWVKPMPLGAIVGCAEIVRVAGTTALFANIVRRELAFGDYSPGRFGWVSQNQLIFDRPIRASGAQKFWVPDDATLAACREAIARAELAKQQGG